MDVALVASPARRAVELGAHGNEYIGKKMTMAPLCIATHTIRAGSSRADKKYEVLINLSTSKASMISGRIGLPGYP